MIIGEGHVETGKKRNIFKKKPGLCWDNYFSDGNILITRGIRDTVYFQQ